MKTIQDVIDKRNELFEKIMDNASFMMIYNGDLAGEEDEEELLRKMQKLDDAIYDFQHDDCGCGERRRLEFLKTLGRDIEKYV